VTGQHDVEYGSRRGCILSQDPELFEDQRWYQVGIINGENNWSLLACGEHHIQRGCGEIEPQSFIKYLQETPQSLISVCDIHCFVLPLLGERQVHVQEQRFSKAGSAKNCSHAPVRMQAVDEGG